MCDRRPSWLAMQVHSPSKALRRVSVSASVLQLTLASVSPVFQVARGVGAPQSSRAQVAAQLQRK